VVRRLVGARGRRQGQAHNQAERQGHHESLHQSLLTTFDDSRVRYISGSMLQAVLVTFREGIESFLIVGIIVAYLRKTNRPGLLRGVHLGIAISVVTCVAGAWAGSGPEPAASSRGSPRWPPPCSWVRSYGRRCARAAASRQNIEERVSRRAGAEGEAPSARAFLGVAW
jgi:hypothetical protein